MDPVLELIAHSRRFALGRPRNITLLDDKVLFLRTRSGTDPVACLWSLDAATGGETLLVDPAPLVDDPEAEVDAEERARRERRRELAEGIVEYSVDAAGRYVVFALTGRLFLLRMDDGSTVELPVSQRAVLASLLNTTQSARPHTQASTRSPQSGVLDPRIDPTGRLIAFATTGGLRVVDRDGKTVLSLDNPAPGVRFGVAEFIAAEELGRESGYWWSPAGDRLLVARIDETPVATWWRADPGKPEAPPVSQRYPAAGASNAEVSLQFVGLDGTSTPVEWATASYPYLVAVAWQPDHSPLITVMDRHHTEQATFSIADDGSAQRVWTDTDDAWVYLVAGTPAWLPDGRLLHARSADDTISLFADDERLTPPGLQVIAVSHVGERVLLLATEEPIEQHVYSWTPVGAAAVATQPDRGGEFNTAQSAGPHESDRGRSPELIRLSDGQGVHTVAGGDTALVLTSERLEGTAVAVLQSADLKPRSLRSVEVLPPLAPSVTLQQVGPDALRTAVFFPRPELGFPRPLPVVLDPYGGTLSQRVRAFGRAFHESQWLADQGFAVVVADGHGSPNRGPAWERTVRFNLGPPALADQLVVLDDVLERWADELDPARVGIRGWSFGGFLAALAVLRRPDRFAAGIAGAAVADWRDYDSLATERYLGLPDEHPEAYARSSLLEDPTPLRRPLLVIQGLADDNVQPVHAFRLAEHLAANGVPPQFAALPGVTHCVRRADDLRSLLQLQAAFFRDTLRPADHSLN